MRSNSKRKALIVCMHYIDAFFTGVHGYVILTEEDTF